MLTTLTQWPRSRWLHGHRVPEVVDYADTLMNNNKTYKKSYKINLKLFWKITTNLSCLKIKLFFENIYLILFERQRQDSVTNLLGTRSCFTVQRVWRQREKIRVDFQFSFYFMYIKIWANWQLLEFKFLLLGPLRFSLKNQVFCFKVAVPAGC